MVSRSKPIKMDIICYGYRPDCPTVEIGNKDLNISYQNFIQKVPYCGCLQLRPIQRRKNLHSIFSIEQTRSGILLQYRRYLRNRSILAKNSDLMHYDVMMTQTRKLRFSNEL